MYINNIVHSQTIKRGVNMLMETTSEENILKPVTKERELEYKKRSEKMKILT